MSTIYYDEVHTPLGDMQVGITELGIAMFEFPVKERIDQHKKLFSNNYEETSIRPSIFDTLKEQISDYFEGKITEFDLPLHFHGTDFQKVVWESLLKVRFGKTISYLELANSIGNPKSVRAVAQANGLNRIPIIVPCHRIIASNGKLTGFSGGLWRKEILLSLESGQNRLTF